MVGVVLPDTKFLAQSHSFFENLKYVPFFFGTKLCYRKV